MKCSIIYGTAWKGERTKGLVELALERGFVAIDTANQLKHYSEALVGEALSEFFKKGHQREELFIQTKFTPIDGQDHRLPYDPQAPLREQVHQSFSKSLEHLQLDYIDSYLLHGPYHHPGLGDEDWLVWEAIEELYLNKKVKKIGVSNFNHLQLSELMEKARVKPMVVQNRCFAQTGWDFHVRKVCQTNDVMYQGFSLLTANPFVLEFPQVIKMAEERKVTTAQIIFAFARQVGMIPLTGTSNRSHMEQDLASVNIQLSQEELEFILLCGLNNQ